MAVNQPKPSDEVIKAFWTGVENFLHRDDPIRDQLQGAEVVGFRIFTLKLPDVLNRTKPEPEKAQTTRWRVLAGDPKRGFISGEVEQRDGKVRLVSISTDARFQKLYDEVSRVRSRPEWSGGENFELRLLTIPSILVDAVLMTSESGNRDSIVLIGVTDRQMQQHLNQALAVADFFGVIQALAEKYKKFDYILPDVSSSG